MSISSADLVYSAMTDANVVALANEVKAAVAALQAGGVGGAPVDATAATLAVTAAAHGGRTVTLNKADGLTATLPAASGSGVKFRFFVGTTVTSVGTIIKVASASDTMSGVAILAADGGDTVVGFETAADTDTITLNGTTKGGILGDVVELEDVAANKWAVKVLGSATGSEASPFSAAV